MPPLSKVQASSGILVNDVGALADRARAAAAERADDR